MKTGQALVVLAAVMALAGCASPPAPPVRLAQAAFRMRDFRLPSGLRVLVEEGHTAPIAATVLAHE